MKAKWVRSWLAILVLAAAQGFLSLGTRAQEKPQYTKAEYDAYNAAAGEKNAQQKIKLLDEFVKQFPESTLLVYVYTQYYAAYAEVRNSAKVVEYADKLLALGDKVDVATRLTASYLRSLHFHSMYSDKMPNASEQLPKARAAAAEGLKILGQLPKPESLNEEQFVQQKKGPAALFHYTAGFAALQMKDYAAAVSSFKAALANNPNDGVTYFRLGVAYLQQDPPQSMDGFWALARSIALKGPGEAQVRDYLRKQLYRYQQTTCENLLDSQMNELLALAGNSAERPAGYNIPSAADLEKARQNVGTFVADLKSGGEKAKVTWLALCGSEFPEVFGKVFEVAEASDNVVLKVYTGSSNEELESATAPNSEVTIIAQPEAKRLEKDSVFRYAATLAKYDPEPFMLHWEKGKVNAEDIPEEKAKPGKAPAKRPAKRPPQRGANGTS